MCSSCSRQYRFWYYLFFGMFRINWSLLRALHDWNNAIRKHRSLLCVFFISHSNICISVPWNNPIFIRFATQCAAYIYRHKWAWELSTTLRYRVLSHKHTSSNNKKKRVIFGHLSTFKMIANIFVCKQFNYIFQMRAIASERHIKFNRSLKWKGGEKKKELCRAAPFAFAAR